MIYPSSKHCLRWWEESTFGQKTPFLPEGPCARAQIAHMVDAAMQSTKHKHCKQSKKIIFFSQLIRNCISVFYHSLGKQ